MLAARVAKKLETFVPFVLAFKARAFHGSPANTFTPATPTPGGLANQVSSFGHFDLGEDEALVVTVDPSGASYLGFQLTDPWMVSSRIHRADGLAQSLAGRRGRRRPLHLRDLEARSRRAQLARPERARHGLHADPLATAPGPAARPARVGGPRAPDLGVGARRRAPAWHRPGHPGRARRATRRPRAGLRAPDRRALGGRNRVRHGNRRSRCIRSIRAITFSSLSRCTRASRPRAARPTIPRDPGTRILRRGTQWASSSRIPSALHQRIVSCSTASSKSYSA